MVGGNVLTSQRITDVVLGAFSACAASQGCCNNLTFGIGGHSSAESSTPGFGYYETIAGGSGAGPGWNGTSGVHVHMTNTRITDTEIFERRYPVILREFSLRAGTGGKGKFRGGEGVIRDIEMRVGMLVSILSERRVFAPYGLQGGGDAEKGLNVWVRKIKDRDGNEIEKRISLGGKNTADMKPGERMIVMTPGGGGWGEVQTQDRGKETGTPDSTTSGVNGDIGTVRDPRFAWKGGSIAARQGTAESSI